MPVRNRQAAAGSLNPLHILASGVLFDWFVHAYAGVWAVRQGANRIDSRSDRESLPRSMMASPDAEDQYLN